MSKPAAIVGTVAMVSLAEALLLFSVAVPTNGSTFAPGPHPIVALVPILGLAAIVSCLNYGLRDWRRRVLSIVVLPIVAWFAFVGVLWLGSELLEAIPFAQEDRATAYLALVLLLVCCMIVIGWRVARQPGVNIEAQRWLDERHSATARAEIVQRQRAIRAALWLPSIVVILAGLYLPETWALISHAVHGRRHHLHGYTVSVPTTWVVLGSEDNGSTFGVVAPGFGRHPFQWLRGGGIPISSWGFGVDDVPLLDRDHNQIVDTRIFPATGGPITCVEYVPNSWRNVNGRYPRVDCSKPNGFSAYMQGEARDVPAFLAVVSRIR